MNMRDRSVLLRTTGLTGIILAAAFIPGVAAAQSEPEDTQVEEIVVTGSRIARQDYVANSPIVTVGQEDFQDTGSVTVDALLNDLPQFAPSINFTSNNPSNGGQANINLRGLGTTRTLTLVNGRRLVPSNSGGQVDVNLIPTALIKNIEIISGGASAAYGSDALAGVTNFILRNDFTGIQFDAQYTITDRNDAEQQSYSVTMGGDFADDRGNLVLSVGRSTRAALYNAAREFSSISGASGTSPLGSTIFDSNNLPSQALVNTYFPGTTPTQVANSSTFGFNNNNTLFAYSGTRNFQSPGGIDYNGFVNNAALNPSNNYVYNTGPLNLGVLPLDRWQAFTAASYQINSAVEFYGEALFTQYEARQELAASPAAGNTPQTGFRVPATNPFIPTDLRTFLNSRPNPNSSFLLNKRFNALGGRGGGDSYTVYQMTGGVRGDIPFRDWTYDGYVSYGQMDDVTTQTGNVSRSAVQRLLDSPTGGADLCTGGFDFFGETSLSASCAAYIGRTSKNTTRYEQTNAELTMQGGLFNWWAGETRFALGLGYREDDYSFLPDALLSQQNAVVARPDGGSNGGSEIAGFNPTPALSGTIQSTEFFGELLIPLARDLPFVRELNLNLGGRVSDYSTVGEVVSYKAEGDWTIVDGVRVRGGFQKAVRAPSIGELYAQQATSFPAIGSPQGAGGAPQLFGDPCDIRSAYRSTSGTNLAAPTNAQVRALCIAQGISAATIDNYTYSNNQAVGITGGNPNLQEEEAETVTVGLVLQPRFEMPMLQRLSASIDYYDIQIENVIGTISASDTLRGCFNATGTTNTNYSNTNTFCQNFQRDPLSGNIFGALETNANLATLLTSGVDLQVDWGFDLADMGLPDYGSLQTQLVVGWLENWERTPFAGAPPVNRTGTIDSTFGNTFPEWKIFSSVDYSINDFSVGVRFRRVGELTQFGTTGANTVILPKTDYFDLNAAYSFNEMLQLRAGVVNLTDQQPRTFSPGVQANTDPSTYDVLGRRFYVGLTSKF